MRLSSDFLRLNYISYAEVAKRIGVRDYSLSSWLTGKTRPAEPDRIAAFLDSLPAEAHSRITPNGYQYREYKVGAVSQGHAVARFLSK